MEERHACACQIIGLDLTMNATEGYCGRDYMFLERFTMQRKVLFCAVAVLTGCSLLITMPTLGHHSFSAQYDAEQSITLTGTLTKLDWRNPHVYFYLDVEGAAGYETWAFEMGSPISMERLGWTRKSANLGDELEVEGSLARDGSKLVNATTVMLTSSGRRMFAGSSQIEGNN